ncbi:hypothetical protein RvY_00381 [Ramazzottius varieornatus]|uniref:Uncharacterized protein n=1 Tax=Ramazzottius varieornatus TaxID=947166 RepID=A0A1D1UDI9_RAMVA|nr:hypothetical protein RvY_00381 [Ramazzottius varieornatus]
MAARNVTSSQSEYSVRGGITVNQDLSSAPVYGAQIPQAPASTVIGDMQGFSPNHPVPDKQEPRPYSDALTDRIEQLGSTTSLMTSAEREEERRQVADVLEQLDNLIRRSSQTSVDGGLQNAKRSDHDLLEGDYNP